MAEAFEVVALISLLTLWKTSTDQFDREIADSVELIKQRFVLVGDDVDLAAGAAAVERAVLVRNSWSVQAALIGQFPLSVATRN